VRVLVVGSGGQLGHAFQHERPDDTLITAMSHMDCDITNFSAVQSAVLASTPDVVVNLAGYTAVDMAETDRQNAFAVNARGAGNVARAATFAGARTIYVSTDYVFDGHRRDPYPVEAEPNPLNVYGESKLAGEREVQAEAKDSIIVRGGWLYSVHGKNFFSRIIELARERPALKVVDDQRGTPSSANDLARILWMCVARPDVRGTYHFANGGDASWYEFAREIISLASARGLLACVPELIPITSEDYRAPARRPAYSVLDASKLLNALGVTSKPWQVALRHVVAEFDDARTRSLEH
jgi:dTDP-4-dehydrorhamnose reductase